MNQLLSGVNVAACAVAGLFLLRFWRQTRDRFFALFAGAFFVLALNWVGLGMTSPSEEARVYFYSLRLCAFLLFLIAIVDKNRPRRSRE